MIEVTISWDYDGNDNMINKLIQWNDQDHSDYLLHNLSDNLNQWFSDNNIYHTYIFDIELLDNMEWNIPSLTFFFENTQDALMFKLRWA